MPENSRATKAGNSIHMIRPNLVNVPQAHLPDGYAIRPLKANEGELWTDIVRDAEPWLDLPADLFDRNFGEDLASVPQRCFFILNLSGEAVGTISAWYRHDFRGLDYGLIHWVAVRPAYQGRGLGKAGLTYALEKMTRWHQRAMLGTQTKRLPAIALYLNFGFLPDLAEPEYREDWRILNSQLHHPVLNGLEL